MYWSKSESLDVLHENKITRKQTSTQIRKVLSCCILKRKKKSVPNQPFEQPARERKSFARPYATAFPENFPKQKRAVTKSERNVKDLPIRSADPLVLWKRLSCTRIRYISVGRWNAPLLALQNRSTNRAFNHFYYCFLAFILYISVPSL
jgi:hypothetical protein